MTFLQPPVTWNNILAIYITPSRKTLSPDRATCSLKLRELHLSSAGHFTWLQFLQGWQRQNLGKVCSPSPFWGINLPTYLTFLAQKRKSHCETPQSRLLQPKHELPSCGNLSCQLSSHCQVPSVTFGLEGSLSPPRTTAGVPVPTVSPLHLQLSLGHSPASHSCHRLLAAV